MIRAVETAAPRQASARPPATGDPAAFEDALAEADGASGADATPTERSRSRSDGPGAATPPEAVEDVDDASPMVGEGVEGTGRSDPIVAAMRGTGRGTGLARHPATDATVGDRAIGTAAVDALGPSGPDGDCDGRTPGTTLREAGTFAAFPNGRATTEAGAGPTSDFAPGHPPSAARSRSGRTERPIGDVRSGPPVPDPDRMPTARGGTGTGVGTGPGGIASSIAFRDGPAHEALQEAALRDVIARHALIGGAAPPASEPARAAAPAPFATPFAAQLSNPLEPAAAMRAVASLAPAAAAETVSLRLKPADLGLVEVEMVRRGGVLSVELRVETPEALRAVEAERGALETMLRGREDGRGASVGMGLRERRERDEHSARMPDGAPTEPDAAARAVPQRVARTI